MRLIFRILGGFILLFLIIISYLYFLGTIDLRTETAKNESNEELAKALLQEMGETHGIANWEKVNTYSAEFEDVFFGTLGSSSHGYAEDSVRFLLKYIPKTFDGKLKFLSGENRGWSWGIQSWKSYVSTAGNGNKFKKDSDILFWLPTYQYFIEFPLRIQNANSFAYAGEAEIDGKNCEGIIASWNTTEPQREIDQYLIWLDKKTKRIVKLEYTIREMFNFLKGAAYFHEYKNYDGILLPSSMPVESNLLKEGFLHEMRILDFSKNTFPEKELRPNRALNPMGDEKLK
ncbi:MAG: hypothetical protein AB8F94_04990 [Saprospiraceae bacterium]